MNERFTVAGIGELLWDQFPSHMRPGGAPTNFACHCHRLGAKAYPVSCVGKDELGLRLREEVWGMGLLKGWPLNKVNSFANIVAAFVCSQKGATPILPVNLVAYLERGGGVVSIQNINRLGVRYERNY